MIRAAQPVLRRVRSRSVWAESLVGGDALQRCHWAGLLEYRLLRFVRRQIRVARSAARSLNGSAGSSRYC